MFSESIGCQVRSGLPDLLSVPHPLDTLAISIKASTKPETENDKYFVVLIFSLFGVAGGSVHPMLTLVQSATEC